MENDIVVRGENVSIAWARTLVAVSDAPEHKSVHVITRVADPTAEDTQIRQMVDRMLDGLDRRPVETVANTLFPRAMALQTPDPDDLAARYLKALPTIQRVDRANARGTYFERLIDYPAPDGRRINQITETIRRIEVERGYKGSKTARYEVGMEDLSTSVPVQEPGRDTSTMDFPCLSLLSFQLDHRERLHVAAHYRSHYLTERAYGNYLAIGRLLAYICGHAGIEPGSMTVVAGYAQVDHYRQSRIETIRPYVNGSDSLA